MAKTNSALNKLPAEVQSAIESLHWHLAAPPMKYKSVAEMKALRPTAIDIEATIQTLTEQATLASKERKYAAQVATALLLLGNGYTDEAHDLVLGLSWRGDLPYAYGTNVNLEDETIQTLACYTHCLVHRMEGPHESEFDMNGFQNADFWAGNTMRNLDGVEALPLTRIKQGVTYLVDSEDAQHFVEKKCRGIHAEWDPRILTELCQQVVVHKRETGSDHPMHAFAEKAALLELKAVLGAALALMGFDVQ